MCNGLQKICQTILNTLKKKKKKLKNLDIKISKRQEKLKNQMIYYLEIIET